MRSSMLLLLLMIVAILAFHFNAISPVHFVKTVKQTGYTLNEWQTFEASEPEIELSPQVLAHGFCLPFHLSHGWILVKGKCNGRPILCRIDTGNSTPQWPQSLNLPVQLTNIQFQSPAVYGGEMTQWKGEVLTNVVIGPLVIKNCPGYAYQDLPAESKPPAFLDIGCSILDKFNVRINYRKQKIYIWPPKTFYQKILQRAPPDPEDDHLTYDPFARKAYMTHFSWSALKPGPGEPVIIGLIDHLPVRLVIDTNASNAGLAITSKPFLDKLLIRCGHSEKNLPAMRRWIAHMPWSLGPFHFNRGIQYLPDMEPSRISADGILGAPVLRDFIVTFQFQEQRITLQRDVPYHRSKSISKRKD
jgi:hypothetical protein